MDKKLFNKSSNFFKREGFYVLLFVCLCIVATVAAITARNNKTKEKPPVVQEQTTPEQDLVLNSSSNTDSVEREINNALEVKNTETPSVVSVPKEGAAAVSKTTQTTFAKPVEGTLARGFTTETVYCETIGTYKTNHGIEIKANINSPVYAVLDGKVEAVGNDKTELGQYVIITHQNGLKSIYGNLDENLSVKVGDTVTKGKVIGKVGKTRESYSEEKFGDHLHFQVMQGKNYVDPAKYITFAVSKNQ